MSSPLLLWHQDLAPEQLEENPIIFGDFIKVGASKDDRLYEEYSDQKKLRNALSEVGVSKGLSILCKSMNKTHTHHLLSKVMSYLCTYVLVSMIHQTSVVPMCVCMCAPAHIHAYMHTYIHTYICTYIRKSILHLFCGTLLHEQRSCFRAQYVAIFHYDTGHSTRRALSTATPASY